MPRQRRLGSAFSDSLSRAAPLVNCGGGEMNQGATIPLTGLFLRFIGTCEVLGGLAMVLPGLLKIRTGLTPLAAAGLVIIMIGAIWITIAEGMALVALIPCTAGVLAAFVA